MGTGHPERPDRLEAIHNSLLKSGLDAALQFVEPPEATAAQVARVHDAGYVSQILSLSPDEGRYVPLDPDTTMNYATVPAALRAAGAVIRGVELVVSGRAASAFCAVRPPGHHACHNRAMGFCFFNNVAVGAGYALSTLGVKRIAILDFDVHHGNGTEDIVRHLWPTSRIDGVLFCSVFQHPYYPYAGDNTDATNVINVPLAGGTRGSTLRKELQRRWFPVIDAFDPDLILVSAGFDGHRDDEMGGWLLVDDDYAWITQRICEIAAAHCDGRIVSVLEGGYELESLGRCVCGHIAKLISASQ